MASSNPRVVLVTGSTSGIGLGIAKAFAEMGYSIIVTGFGDTQLIDSILSELNQLTTAGVHYISADLCKAEEIEDLYKKVKEIHPEGVDILINNAGFGRPSSIEDLSLDVWNKSITCMLTAPFHLIKLFLPDMKKKGWGRIVNTSSVVGVVGLPLLSAYTTVKHGLIGLTKAVALETATTGVTCNAICPGYTNTPMIQNGVNATATKENMSFEDTMTRMLSPMPTKRLIEVEQVVDAIKFMCCSSASDQMTGTSLLLDGGWTAQ